MESMENLFNNQQTKSYSREVELLVQDRQERLATLRAENESITEKIKKDRLESQFKLYEELSKKALNNYSNELERIENLKTEFLKQRGLERAKNGYLNVMEGLKHLLS